MYNNSISSINNIANNNIGDNIGYNSSNSNGDTAKMANSRHKQAKRWSYEEIDSLFNLPFNDLLFQAHQVHRRHFNPNQIQVSTLLSIKTGGCPEDCKYCPQSSHYDTGLKPSKLMQLEEVLAKAKQAKQAGASRFCMGAAWRSPKNRDMPKVTAMIKAVKALGLETCATLGTLDKEQAEQLKKSGLDYYNHNIDSSEEIYKKIITTRTYQERLQTLENVAEAGLKTCCGGIIGLGEAKKDRIEMVLTLANMASPPESVPINKLIKVKGTPLAEEARAEHGRAGKPEVSDTDFIRMIAVCRITMPHSYVRLSAGREEMGEAMQAMCFFAGANSIFYGEKLLTAANPAEDEDKAMFQKLGIEPI